MTEQIKMSDEEDRISRRADILRQYKGTPGHDAMIDVIREKLAQSIETLLSVTTTEQLLSAQGYARSLRDMEGLLDEQLASADQIARRLDAQNARRNEKVAIGSRPQPEPWRPSHRYEKGIAV